ncbi:MAG: TerB family tellurite resistance protein, partial [Microcystaceae cyanobacterium]
QECYQWLQDYLGDNPTEQDYLELLDTVSGLLYSDGDIQTQEAQLLNTLQTLDPTHREDLSPLDQVLRTIQGLYRRALAQGFEQ